MHGGGAFLLTLSVFAGVLLILPAVTTQNNQVHAATEVIDGVTYEVIYLQGDSNPTQSNTIFSGTQTKNYRYVLMDNWDLTKHKVGWGVKNEVKGSSIIFDLNGHTVTSSSSANGGYFLLFRCSNTFEFTDSSSTGGSITLSAFANSMIPKKVIVSGSGSYSVDAATYSNTSCSVTVRGGKWFRIRNYSNDYNKGVTFTVAPYMTSTVSAGANEYRASHDAYAVSTNNGIVSGAYNYEFGQAWELGVGELSKLSLADDKIYYLWGRKSAGEYVYLNIIYRDGEWRNAA